MALVFTQAGPVHVVGDRKTINGTVTFTGATSYLTGGVATVAADYGLQQLDAIDVVGVSGAAVTLTSLAGVYKYLICTTLPGITEVSNAGSPVPAIIQVQAVGY